MADNDEGRTHFQGDGCVPPHPCVQCGKPLAPYGVAVPVKRDRYGRAEWPESAGPPIDIDDIARRREAGEPWDTIAADYELRVRPC